MSATPSACDSIEPNLDTLNFSAVGVAAHQTGHRADVVIHRPGAMNALNAEVLSDLADAFAGLAASDTPPRVVVLSGMGKAFVAGADIRAMASFSSSEARDFARLGHRVFAQIESFAAPVIAAVGGFALGGGCELLLACDLVYASQKARFGQPEVNLGILPGFGGTFRLASKIGVPAATEWILTGEMWSAEQAQAKGLVAEVLAPEALMPRVHEITSQIASRGPAAVAASKRLLRAGQAVPSATAMEMEIRAFGEIFTSKDAQEGIQAFLNKRPAQFTGTVND